MKYPYAVIWNGKVYPAGADVPTEEQTELSEHMNAPEKDPVEDEKPQTARRRAGRPSKK